MRKKKINFVDLHDLIFFIFRNYLLITFTTILFATASYIFSFSLKSSFKYSIKISYPKESDQFPYLYKELFNDDSIVSNKNNYLTSVIQRNILNEENFVKFTNDNVSTN